MLLRALFLATMAIAVSAFDKNKISNELKQANVIPNVLNEFDINSELRITYHVTKAVMMGATLTSHDIETPPHVWFPAPDKANQYTLIMFDIDATGTPQHRHWIVTNIDGGKPGTSVADNTDVHQYTPYMGHDNHSEGTRYVIALFEQSTLDQVMQPALGELPEDRANFDLKKFVEDNALKPVTALFFDVK